MPGSGVSPQFSPFTTQQRGYRDLPAGGCRPNSSPSPKAKGCRGLPAGGLGVSPNFSPIPYPKGARGPTPAT